MNSSDVENYLKKIIGVLPSDSFDNDGSKEALRVILKEVYGQGLRDGEYASRQ